MLKIAQSVIRFTTLLALPVAGYAAVAFGAPPALNQLTDSELRYEATKSLAATIGNCGVSANILALTALADSVPGASLISKAAVNDDENPDNEVLKAQLQTDKSVQNATVVLGGIFSIPIEIVVDAVDFFRDGSVIDGERAENQLGDQLNLGYAATREILKTKMGENSKCRVNGERFQSILFEMSDRYYAPHVATPAAAPADKITRPTSPVIPPAAQIPAQVPEIAPEQDVPGTSTTTVIIIEQKDLNEKKN